MATRYTFRRFLTTSKRTNMAGTSRCCWQCLDPKDFPCRNDALESSCSSSRLFIKPPNIFCRNLDKQAIESFKSTVDPSLYTLYALSDNDWKFNVWQNSTNLLIISDNSSVENQSDEIAKVNGMLSLHFAFTVWNFAYGIIMQHEGYPIHLFISIFLTLLLCRLVITL